MPASALPLRRGNGRSEPTQQAVSPVQTFEGEEVRRWTQTRVVSALVEAVFTCFALHLCAPLLCAGTHPTNTIICREELTTARRELLAAKLRVITGLSVKFDESGALQATSSQPRGGSQSARSLLLKALDGSRVLVLEDASDRPDVVFSRVVPAKLKHRASEMPETFVVLIDFADFDQLMGDEQALRAFDVGWAFLHELDHVVNDSVDSERPNEQGECEDHINIMRRECNLATRADYFYGYVPASIHSEFRTRFVRLPFDHADARGKKHRYWVMWDATVVGGLTQQIARSR